MQTPPELLQAEREADKCITELITLKDQTVDMMHKHLDKARELGWIV